MTAPRHYLRPLPELRAQLEAIADAVAASDAMLPFPDAVRITGADLLDELERWRALLPQTVRPSVPCQCHVAIGPEGQVQLVVTPS